jgi:hypothetical protein
MDSAGPFGAVHRNLCAARKGNEASDFGAGLGGIEFPGGDEAAKIELTYSTTASISRVDQRWKR